MSDATSGIAGLRAALAVSEVRAEAAESELAQTRGVVSTSEAMIKHLRLEIARLRREQYGQSSGRCARLNDQMELQLEELQAAATEDEIAAGKVVKTTSVAGLKRRRPARKPFPEHLPRERVVIAAPTACSCCGSDRIVKMGEEITETLEVSLSTLADQVGACVTALEPIHELIRNHVLQAKRLHGDDTTVPPLAKGGTRTARLWTYVRDDRLFAGGAPPAALFHFSRDREMAHPNRHLARWQGILQADACGGYNDLCRGDRDPGPVGSALCWSHARRKFFELADIKGNVRRGKPAHNISPVALEAVTRIDTIFDIERQINGLDAA